MFILKVNIEIVIDEQKGIIAFFSRTPNFPVYLLHLKEENKFTSYETNLGEPILTFMKAGWCTFSDAEGKVIFLCHFSYKEEHELLSYVHSHYLLSPLSIFIFFQQFRENDYPK